MSPAAPPPTPQPLKRGEIALLVLVASIVLFPLGLVLLLIAAVFLEFGR